MNNRFTQKAQNALTRALSAAGEFGHTYIGSEHLLFGLLTESEGIAAKMLESKGLHSERLKEAIGTACGLGTKTNVSPTDMTPRTKIRDQLYRHRASPSCSSERDRVRCRETSPLSRRESR